ncbi:hypothetical protein HK104_005533 [Borealophlyctis nickersoniae]|nr:hypothetical protein HK104_005533 [Borealophlyctis nickersoniae]
MEGTIFKYDPTSNHIAIQYNNNLKNTAILIPGQGEGPNSLPYTPLLTQTLAALGFSLLQYTSASSYAQYGTSSLNADTRSLDAVISHLQQNTEGGADGRKIILIGHSTGAQGVVHYLTHGTNKGVVRAGILQGPVSDVEYAMWKDLEGVKRWGKVAGELLEAGKGDEVLPREAYEVPITAYRYNSLFSFGGDDDYFSSNLSPASLRALLNPIRTPLAIFLSGSDEYVPPHVDVPALLQRFLNAREDGSEGNGGGVPRTFGVIIRGADHAISGKEEQEVFCGWVEECLRGLA